MVSKYFKQNNTFSISKGNFLPCWKPNCIPLLGHLNRCILILVLTYMFFHNLISSLTYLALTNVNEDKKQEKFMRFNVSLYYTFQPHIVKEGALNRRNKYRMEIYSYISSHTHIHPLTFIPRRKTKTTTRHSCLFSLHMRENRQRRSNCDRQ